MKTVMSFLLLAIALTLGCASGLGTAAAEQNASAYATLTITNDRFYDAAVFIVHDGSRGRRLDGYVTGNAARTFVLKSSDFADGRLQLLAKYVGDGMTVLSDEVTGIAGMHYTWQLGPQRGHQFLSRSYASAP